MITTQHQAKSLDAFAQFGLPDDHSPAWLKSKREAALTHFQEIGLPTSRSEEWRFTNINPIRQRQFQIPTLPVDPTPSDIQRFAIEGLKGPRLVFANGRYCPALSDLADVAGDIHIGSLAAAYRSHGHLLEEYLGKQADIRDEPFTALNTALATDGTFIHVRRGCELEHPIHLLYVTTANREPVLTNPRNLVITEAGSSVTVVEDYVTLANDVYLTNAVTEIVVGQGARASHYLLERESERAYRIASLHVRQLRDSRFVSHSILLGGAIVRNHICPVLDGEGCDSLLNGLYVLGGEQVADNHMRVVHAAAHGDSRQIFKGIMKDRSHGVFRGRIVVRPGAQKTDAKQSNQNLLLSNDATANTDPQLEIYADDVKCTHGATIGQIDKDQVFYLRSRGITEKMARAMIVYAFASDSIERMELEPIRRYLRSAVLSHLPEEAVLAQSL